MAIYTYNGADIIVPVTITSNEPFFDMDTVSLKSQRASQNHQRWELSFNVVNTKDTEADSLISSTRDVGATSTMVMPQLPSAADNNVYPSKAYLLSTLALASTSATIVVENANLDAVKIKKGTFFKFKNHSKLYVITSSDITKTGSNNENFAINFFPALIKQEAGGSTNDMKFGDDCVLSFKRSLDNISGITFQDGVLSNPGRISLFEAL